MAQPQREHALDVAMPIPIMRSERRHGWLIDSACAVLLMAAVVGYLAALPLNLQSPDEARHLDHARRLLNGEVLYRDVFDITTPGWVYLMTAVFAVFGTTLAAARATVAVIHGCTAVALFIACRRLGVRRELAWACAFTAVVFSQRLFRNASYHWLATLLAVDIVLLCLLSRRTARWAFTIGVAVGLLIAVHQQRGAAFGLGVVVFYVAQWVVDRLHRNIQSFAVLFRQLLAVAAGVLVVMLPLFAVMIGMAGFGPVWECLVTATIVNYRGAMHTWWGNSWGGSNVFIFVARWVPFALIPTALIAGARCWRQRDYEAARQSVLLTVFGLASLFSIAYFPDTVHLGLILPIFILLVANLIESALRLLPSRLDRAFGVLVSSVVLIAVGARAYRNVVEMRAMFPIPYETAFGHVDLSAKMAAVEIGRHQVAYWDQLREVVNSSPGRLLYVHPVAIYTHLLVDARNPTRYDLVLPPVYTSASQMQEVVDALAKSRVQYVVWAPPTGRTNTSDTVARFIREHYEKSSAPPPLGQSLWELKRPAKPDL